MRVDKLLIGVAALAMIATVSGCICCCGLDGYLSKMKKPVSAISAPEELVVGGRTYHRLHTIDYLGRAEAKAGFREFIRTLGYTSPMYARNADYVIDAGEIDEYKWFEYADDQGNVSFGGFVARAGGPFVVSAGLQSLKGLLDTSMPLINDRGINDGGIWNVTNSGASDVGDGGVRYRFVADYDDSVRECYFTVIRYSNTYVAVYSFESFSAAADVSRLVTRWIDVAAADQ